MYSTPEPEKNMYGLFVVTEEKHPRHWAAWREWYAHALRRTFFPAKATTLFAWPPTTGEQVIAVLAYLKGVQDEVKQEAKQKRLPQPRLAPIPDIAPVYGRMPPQVGYSTHAAE